MDRYFNVESVFYTNAALGESKLEEHEPIGSKHKKGKPIEVEKILKPSNINKKQHVVTKIDK
jgi:hypothetical protein